MLSARRMASPIEERPAFGSTLDDLHDLRLERYFRDRFQEWSRPDDWAHSLVTHKLAASTDSAVTPTHLGILLFAEQPERFLPGAYVDVAAYHQDTADGNTVDSRRITGPLPEQIGQVLTYFRSSPLIPTASRKDGDGRHDFRAMRRLRFRKPLSIRSSTATTRRADHRSSSACSPSASNSRTPAPCTTR